MTDVLASVTVKILDARSASSTRYKTNFIISCFSRFDSSAYNRLQFLLAVSLSMGAHSEAFHQTDDSSSSSSNGGEDAETEAPTATV